MWSPVTFTEAEGWPSQYSHPDVLYQGAFGAQLTVWSDYTPTVLWEGDPGLVFERDEHPEYSAYYKVWKRDYPDISTYLIQPDEEVVYEFAWGLNSPAQMREDRGWWVGERFVDEDPSPVLYRMVYTMDSDGTIVEHLAPSSVGSVSADNVVPISDTEAIYVGLRHEFGMFGWARLAAWKVTDAGVHTLLGDYIFGYEWLSGPDPVNANYDSRTPLYNADLDRGILIHAADPTATPDVDNRHYVLFTTNGGTNLEIIADGDFLAEIGYTDFLFNHTIHIPQWTDNGTLVVMAYPEGSFETQMLLEIDVSGSSLELVNAAQVPTELFQNHQQFTYPGGGIGMIGSSFPDDWPASPYGWYLWLAPFGGSVVVPISLPTDEMPELSPAWEAPVGDYAYWRVQFPWVIANIALAASDSPFPEFGVQTMTYLGILFVPPVNTLEGSLDEARLEFIGDPVI